MRISPLQAAIAATVVAAAAAVLVHDAPRVAEAAGSRKPAKYTTWSDYLGDADSEQYSALKQIDRTNVSQLQQVWFYPAGDNANRYGFNPLVVDNTMIVMGRQNSIVALDATTGKEIWVHDNHNSRLVTHRGINYWASADGGDRRLFTTVNNHLIALDFKTGKLIESFGNQGSVDLREGLGRDPNTITQIRSGTPGRIFENLLILGSATGEEYNSPPGDLRAYDVRSGKLVWQFHTLPHPGEMGYDTWPKEAYKYIGGVNAWGEITVDTKRGIAYFPLGSPTYDFYGADRIGANLFSDCLLALDARTGKYLWHFQTTHHDLWDYDLETSPKLLTITKDGKKIDVVAESGKNGFLWVLDRLTGKPVWPVEERPVPKSDMPGEQSWPTQPFPRQIPPFAKQMFSADDINPYIPDPKERESIRQQVLHARNQGIYTPPSTENTLETPGNNGGANWGSGSVDPATNTLYVVSKNAPSMLKLAPRSPRQMMTGTPETLGKIIYIQNCQMCHTATLEGQPPAIPSLVAVVERKGADRVRATIHEGSAPMPAFPDLNSRELTQLLAYLQSPGKADVPADVVAALNGPKQSIKDSEGRTRYWTGYGYMNSSTGLAAIGPPWSTITAYDMNHGTIKWQIPLGGMTALDAKGVKGTGSFWPRGGAVVTAGGLILVGTRSDSKLHAYDKDTGKLIWETVLPAGPQGIPAVYEINGREYVALAAQAVPEPGQRTTKPSGAETTGYYVFALPEKR